MLLKLYHFGKEEVKSSCRSEVFYYLSHLSGIHTFPVCVGGPVDPGTASGEYRVRHRTLQTLPLPTGGAPQLPEDGASHRNQERGKQLPLLHSQ